jgi:hypothetical protein
MDEAKTIAGSRRAVMVAPGGCGKTHTIARAVSEFGGGRELVLTHTNAGVGVLRTRLDDFGTSRRQYRVDTIAGWALGLASAFPDTSQLGNAAPRTSGDYTAVYSATVRLLEARSIREIMRASYTGVYVDEYQDCTMGQHELTLALAEVLPCRVVGDPLQGIFNFPGSPTVDWATHVEAEFEGLPGPRTPWRWSKSNPELGEWLGDVRAKIAADPPQELDLRDAPVEIQRSTDSNKMRQGQLSACYSAAGCSTDTVVAIHALPNQCHHVACRLGGRFSCVEPIDSPDLYQAAERIGESNGAARAVEVIDFAACCMTKVSTEMKTIRSALSAGRNPRTSKHTGQLLDLQRVVDDPSLVPVNAALQSLSRIDGCRVYRRELLRDMGKAIESAILGEAASLAEAAWVVRNRTRRQGRALPRCAVGTTLLVKGLEFDQAILLDADALKARSLYVALTRGSKSLSVVCKTDRLQPKPGC